MHFLLHVLARTSTDLWPPREGVEEMYVARQCLVKFFIVFMLCAIA